MLNWMKHKQLQTPAQTLNNWTYNNYVERLQNLAINMFEWRNLPDTVDERFLELTLCEFGMAVYFRDEVMGDLALTVAINGKWNVYRIPIRRTAYASNSYRRQLTDRNSVIIWNNYLHTPTMDTVLLFAKRLTEIERAIDVNVQAQKTPILIATDESQLLTVKNIYRNYKDNEPVIYGAKGISPTTLQVLNTNAPFVADKLQILKRQIWNEFLTFIGVENSNTEKRERLVTDEITSNLGGVEAQRYVMLNARQRAAEEINRMFGTNIEVEFRQDFSNILGADLWRGDTAEGRENPTDGGE